MSLAEIDRQLLYRCLERKPRAWEDLVDRFMGLVLHVIDHSAESRGFRLEPTRRDALCEAVFEEIVADDFALLRRYRTHSSLATYLTVIARRIVVRALLEEPYPETDDFLTPMP
jgi:RNA polymerase sigma-70 factor (ECF subfamily)